ncbi:MAG TPA: flagellar basal-body MS-ring/collar protein FliF [Candidatus Sulfotelmatobacter sp.]|nr:flagellar basal-body MS-ring/collar protein FliF [Candidatus Sulfotelmatobacter sp.]
MAEAGAGFDIRRLLLIGGVVAVISVSLVFFLYRGCAPVVGRNAGYTMIYTNLDLKDAANVIARLKELAVPYEIRDEGKSVAVPRDKADQARLGLAEKNLPLGGVVGWEIFDESRLGATDFDRRIQLIRATSGELSRTIRRIDGVEDARVQVVIPETKLFAATSAPVTAAVMLRLRPGFELATSKIRGIVYLVASSVENLQPENITVIDESGKILTAQLATAAKPAEIVPPPPAETAPTLPTLPAATTTTTLVPPAAKIKEVGSAKAGLKVSAEAVVTAVASLSAEQKIALKIQAKKELEQDLSGKAQELLNRFFPPNAVIVKVQTEIKPTKEIELRAKYLKIKKLTAIVLIDNRIDLNPKLKQATYTTVAAAVGYDKKRKDVIILQKVPFHLATPLLLTREARTGAARLSLRAMVIGKLMKYSWVIAAALGVLLLFWWIGNLRRSRETLAPEIGEMAEPPAQRPAAQTGSTLDQMKTMADRNPEMIADLLKKWLSE